MEETVQKGRRDGTSGYGGPSQVMRKDVCEHLPWTVERR